MADDLNDSDTMLAAGAAQARPELLGSGAYAVVPEGYAIEDLERFFDSPARARATVTAKTAETFAAYVNRFKSEGSAIFADQEKFALVGIIDYHQPGLPAFREHWVAYAAPRSLEWQTWRGKNGEKMEQAAFAQFIEDNVVDIRAPAGAEVLEVARGLQAKKAVEFASAIRLADGAQQFTYNETIDGTTSKGTMKVPEEFTLGIPVFFGGVVYGVVARLRYRISQGKLLLWYELYRPEYIERDAFEELANKIATDTAIEVWHGVP